MWTSLSHRRTLKSTTTSSGVSVKVDVIGSILRVKDGDIVAVWGYLLELFPNKQDKKGDADFRGFTRINNLNPRKSA